VGKKSAEKVKQTILLVLQFGRHFSWKDLATEETSGRGEIGERVHIRVSLYRELITILSQP
jgi:hypothetical protein